jgi:hypothetical protein
LRTILGGWARRGFVCLVFCCSVARAQAPATGSLVIVTAPLGAELRVDGNVVGKSPGSVNNLLGGDHLVEATWPDGRSANAIGRVTPGQSTLVNLAPSTGATTPEATAPGATAAPATSATATSEPAPAPAATAPPDPNATASAAVMRGDLAVRLPLHPQRRHLLGLSFGPGVLCSTATCTFRARIGFDFALGDFHVTALGGGYIAGGIGAGVEIGTPYFQLGHLTSPAALAVRASVDVLGIFGAGGVDQFGNVITATVGGLATNTYGPNFSLGLAHRVALEARIGFGYGVTFPTVTVPFLLESWLAVRVQP